MKVDRRNPRHWFRLCRFALAVLAAAVLRRIGAVRTNRRRVVFYGHRLAGNLQPIHDAVRAGAIPGVDAAFLTMDPSYRNALHESGVHAILAGSLESVRWLADASVIVSDHGLHAMQFLLRWSDIRFADVWHGIPFKGFDAADFVVHHRYDETWVASPLMAEMYVQRFGVAPSRVRGTGYSRTDVLVRGAPDLATVRREFGLPSEGKIVLFAPTWRQDDAGRQIIPFSLDVEAFLDAMAETASAHGATAVLRLHLNSEASSRFERPGLRLVPFADHPATERLLLASDVLVCDWSSIAFDYLLLDRPTIFLDVPAPFRKGFSLGHEYRFGAIAEGRRAMERFIGEFIADPGVYAAMFGAAAEEVRRRIYGAYADGEATRRCLDRLEALVTDRPRARRSSRGAGAIGTPTA